MVPRWAFSSVVIFALMAVSATVWGCINCIRAEKAVIKADIAYANRDTAVAHGQAEVRRWIFEYRCLANARNLDAQTINALTNLANLPANQKNMVRPASVHPEDETNTPFGEIPEGRGEGVLDAKGSPEGDNKEILPPMR